ncbi:hypothetical protein SAMN05216559_3817 [Halomicrobium zhouii]|uniref:Uncharacterized protein n=1 Tax=Halomicrobium zhouii TaxID=767519 RepID=A0A1I6M568_9EURY|nr:hypothetical protein [Halomicrobium zhouii]SFS10836.1 hypothetical protein SAMN05216559_3817 [Halomicrobium zhouii]
MVDRIAEARKLVEEASDVTDDATVQEQLHSIDEGFAVLADEPDDAVKGDRLEEVEAKLVGLGDELDDEDRVHHLIENARDHVDAFRREKAQNW